MAGAGGRPYRLTPLHAAAGPLLERLGPLFDGLETPVVVACSGGSDSLALLALAAAAELSPTAVHVDHGSRPGGDVEAAAVAGFAAALEAGFAAERVTVPPGPGFEARARDARYEALERARRRLGAATVLVGHTRDDQAETVLLNLLRGGATTGLAGIPPRRAAFVRPLLGVPRSDLAELCARLALEPLVDPMNADSVHRRVWLRREVIPALERGAGRDLRALLARQAELLRSESDLLDRLADEALAGAGDPLPAAVLMELPGPLARRAVRRWLGSPPPSAEHVEEVLTVAAGRRRAADLPGGVRVARSGAHLHRLETPVDRSPPAPVPVALPGTARGFGLTVEAWVEGAAPLQWPDGRWSAVVDADRAGQEAVLRPPREGERFTPLGLSGHKAVSDALAEVGIPPETRRRHPVLATPSGETLWVLGYRIDERVRVSAQTRRFLWLTAEAGGGRG